MYGSVNAYDSVDRLIMRNLLNHDKAQISEWIFCVIITQLYIYILICLIAIKSFVIRLIGNIIL